MDISAIIVVLVLTALSLSGVMWLEIHSRKNAAKARNRDGSNPELNEE